MKCLRCSIEMTNHGKQEFQLGCTGILFGNLSNIVSGSMILEVYSCPECRKVEFFLPYESDMNLSDNEGDSDKELPKVTCPECGTEHDFDYPKCPECGHVYEYEDQ